MIAMIAPKDNDRVIGMPSLFQSIEYATNLAIDEAGGCQVRAHQIDRLVILFDPFLPWLW